MLAILYFTLTVGATPTSPVSNDEPPELPTAEAPAPEASVDAPDVPKFEVLPEEDNDRSAVPEIQAAPKHEHSGKLWMERPSLFYPRRPVGAAALGLVVGFGTGFYYAGAPGRGAAFSAADTLLWAGLLGVTAALNQLVVLHDFRTGQSLRRRERPFGRKEKALYGASWVIAGLLLTSHGYQGFASLAVAEKTNRTLRNFSYVPIESGGAVNYTLRW